MDLSGSTNPSPEKKLGPILDVDIRVEGRNSSVVTLSWKLCGIRSGCGVPAYNHWASSGNDEGRWGWVGRTWGISSNIVSHLSFCPWLRTDRHHVGTYWGLVCIFKKLFKSIPPFRRPRASKDESVHDSTCTYTKSDDVVVPTPNINRREHCCGHQYLVIFCCSNVLVSLELYSTPERFQFGDPICLPSAIIPLPKQQRHPMPFTIPIESRPAHISQMMHTRQLPGANVSRKIPPPKTSQTHSHPRRPAQSPSSQTPPPPCRGW
jgi:hypothetical protein